MLKRSLCAGKPVGLKWRSSSWMITFVIGLGIAVDLLVYSIIIPVMPFQLERLGYTGVAALTGWLLFAYASFLPPCASLLATIPIAMLSERYNARRMPLVFGLLLLIGSQVMLMEAPNYPVMCIARILQGIGSSMVWVVGLALLYVSIMQTFKGIDLSRNDRYCFSKQIRLAIGPPVGGTLYSRFGYRGPFIFGICAAFLDLLGRMIIIERKDALLWGVDPAFVRPGSDANDSSPPEVGEDRSGQVQKVTTDLITNKASESKDSPIPTDVQPDVQPSEMSTAESPPSLLAVIVKLAKSPRACVVYSSQEPSIPLHLQHVWNLDSATVGLIFIAAVVPTLFSLPWWVVVIIQRRLALFVVAFAIESFFTSGVISPLTAELAAVSREWSIQPDGHVYGAFNLAYGIGTSIGPIVGGQIYDHLRRGWMALCLLATGLLAFCFVLAICFVGNDPLLHRLLRRFRASSSTIDVAP
ncbi:major facilitator superfamily domain-containing protein [Flammula alnicola]|nr:major facilitator superfamily domain-containing protein [Flammula alnicola]